MQHCFQVSINVEDERIIKNVEENAERTILNNIQYEIQKRIAHRRGYGYNEDPLEDMIKDEVTKVIEENKERIITMAADNLAKRLSRTKAAKAAVANLGDANEI